ncbi:MAG: PhoPQ-activated pathogenicity-related family protein [Bacteroidota bacterium]
MFACTSPITTVPEPTESGPLPTSGITALDTYVASPDTHFRYEKLAKIPGEGYTTHVIRMVSQHWLTTAEVKKPEWWHWLTLVVPEAVSSPKGLLFIGGGSRNREQPKGADELTIQTALATQTVVANLHNVPNEPIEFIGDNFGPRTEDEIIAYGWRQFLEGGGKTADAKWLARLPMTKAAVKAMDVIEMLTSEILESPVDQFVVAGGSKRGWTTWTTAAVDDRVVAIAPIVIDLLNVVPSFEHHWRVYGFWAPAVGDYVREGIMEWQNSREYDALLATTEPYSYRDRYTMPKMIINATGDQFFIPDSWQFYWEDLPAEKHLRYVPNSEHSMDGTDALETLIAFYSHIVTETPRPDFDWTVEEGVITITPQADFPPQSVTLWQAHNPDARDFRVDVIGRTYEPSIVTPEADGRYVLEVDAPEQGYTAFFGELTFQTAAPVPFKMSTGVVVLPNTYPFEPFQASNPMGTPR